ncbi:serine hydrolase, partial [Streptomyces sp. NPDC059564]|uniref:D-alanyl-D-alanine carboxypeptidase n=1 Tax=Streptomyces sp. NPDC059564 TaxID=3346865 RepID=UPI0036AD86F7
ADAEPADTKRKPGQTPEEPAEPANGANSAPADAEQEPAEAESLSDAEPEDHAPHPATPDGADDAAPGATEPEHPDQDADPADTPSAEAAQTPPAPAGPAPTTPEQPPADAPDGPQVAANPARPSRNGGTTEGAGDEAAAGTPEDAAPTRQEEAKATPAEAATQHERDGDSAEDADRPKPDASAAEGGTPNRARPSWAKPTPAGADGATQPEEGGGNTNDAARPKPEGAAAGKAEDGTTAAPRPTAEAPAQPKEDGGSTADTARPKAAAGDAASAQPGAADSRRPAWAKADPARAGAADAQDTKPAPSEADAAGGVESDAERTSQFVALKPLEVKPAPVVKPEPERPARPEVVEATQEAPLPPLDLLAELTNTAPPPETPRRTIARRVKVWTPIVLLLAATATGVQLVRPLPAAQLVAGEDSYTLDGETSIPWPAKGQGAVRVPGSGDIATFGEQKPVPTASVAKVMTAYVILKNHPLRKNDPGPGVEVDAVAVAEGMAGDESRIQGLTAGTKFSQQDMLKMLMIPSGNNIARLLARWDTGSTTPDAFVAKMNAAAKELGMKDTTYTDPSGLDAGTVSTAVDQLKLAEAVMKEDAFRAVVSLPSETVEGVREPLINNNGLLVARGLNVMGIKTGSSSAAGGTLSWATYKTVGGETPLILGTLMDQHVDGPDPEGANGLKLVLANSRKIVEAVRTALASAPVIHKGQVVGHVSDGLGGRTPLVATKDLSMAAVPGQRLRLSLGAGDKPVPHAAKAGTEVGVLTVGDGAGAKTVPVAVGTDLAEPSFGKRVTRLS